MKKLLPIILLIIFSGCITYKLVSLDGATNETVINLEGKKSKLYVMANEWMVQAFNNAESVIQFQDKEEGVIIGKYLLKSIGPGL